MVSPSEANCSYNQIFGRKYGNPFFEEFMTEDADVVLLGMGTMSMPMHVAIRDLRKEGIKVGFVRLRWFRPFPAEELAKCLSRFKAVGVVDRDFSFGSPYLSGVVATEVRTALYPGKGPKPPVLGFICGLGGHVSGRRDDDRQDPRGCGRQVRTAYAMDRAAGLARR